MTDRVSVWFVLFGSSRNLLAGTFVTLEQPTLTVDILLAALQPAGASWQELTKTTYGPVWE